MKRDVESTARETARAEAELAALHGQIGIAREVLERLQREIADASRRLGNPSAVTLAEVNARLVESTLLAQVQAQEAVQAHGEATRMARVDELTQLPTRAVLLEHLDRAVANAKRYRTRAALLFVDLDNFKQINDSFGHAIGDEVLRLTAQRMLSSVRDVDTVSRHGGDEFLILLTDVSEKEDAAVVAAQVAKAVAKPHAISGGELQVAASIGISFYPDHGDEASALIDYADAAMYCSKRQGGGGVALHRDTQAGPPVFR